MAVKIFDLEFSDYNSNKDIYQLHAYFKPFDFLTITLFSLTREEFEFKGGRFKNYRLIKNPVIIKTSCTKDLSNHYDCNDGVSKWFEEYPDYVWYLKIDYKHMGDIDLLWHFENNEAATLFRLTI